MPGVRRTASRSVALVVLLLGCCVLPSGASAAGEEAQLRAQTSDPAFKAARAKASTAFSQRAAERGRSAERSARADSRTAHHALSSGDARRLARTTFPSATTAPVWAPLRLAPDEHFDSYVNDFSARIERDGKPALLAQTFVPMRDLDAAGVLRRVDLRLQSQATVITSANPLVDLTIAKDIREGLRFEKTGIAVAPVGFKEVAGTIANDHVLAENVATDTDQVVEPTSTGAEFSWQLRSRESPESARLRFTLPAGAGLRLAAAATATGRSADRESAELLVVRDGEVLARVAPPLVVDADGTRVSSWYELDGDDLVMRFPHRSLDVKYPLLADPQVTETFSSGQWRSPDDAYPNVTTVWRHISNSPVDMAFAVNCCGRSGLQIGLFQNTAYPQGVVGQWYFRAYPDSYIVRADFGGLESITDGSSLYTGVSSAQGSWEDVGFEYGDFNGRTVVRGGNGDNNAANLGLFSESGTARSSGAFVGMTNATVYLGDRHPPTYSAISHSYDTGTWTNASAASVGFHVHDNGLGFKKISVVRTDRGDPNDGTAANDYTVGVAYTDEPANSPAGGCTGNRRYGCLHEFDSYYEGSENLNPDYTSEGLFRYPVSGLPEGANTLRFDTQEVAGEQTVSHGPNWNVKIDRTAPELSIVGDLRDLESVDESGRDLFSLHIDATDGNPTGPPSTRRAGVSSIRAFVETGGTYAEQPLEINPRSCGDDSCAMGADFELDTDDFNEGLHHVRVESRDALDHLAQQEWTIQIGRGNYYDSKLVAWEQSTRQAIDAANPLPIVGTFPDAPRRWSDPAACRDSTAAMQSCFDANQTWAHQVRDFLQTNPMLTKRPDSLPTPPIFEYARSQVARNLTVSASGAFTVVTSAASGLAGNLRVAVSFDRPLKADEITDLFPDIDVKTNMALTSNFEPGDANISGTRIQTVALSLS